MDTNLQAEEGEIVRQALLQLPEIYRAVLVLRHYERMKLAEIAETLGIPVGTVNSRLAKASAVETQRAWQDFLEVLASARTDDARALQVALQAVQERHEAQFVALRKDLETLASMTDDEIRDARHKLVQLAAYQTMTQ